MRAEKIIATLRERGAEMRVHGPTLRIRPVEALDAALTAEIHTHAAELLVLLEKTIWPQECRDAARRFRTPHARLYPLLDRTVSTPMGNGKLIQVLGPDHVAVVLDSDRTRSVFFHWRDVEPRRREL